MIRKMNMKARYLSLAALIACCLPGAASAQNAWVKGQAIYSIGIFLSGSPLKLDATQTVSNPVLTRADVTDVPARYVADPFMIQKDSIWYMFFEVLNDSNGKGEIAYATSQDALSWQYGGIVLTETFHLSYPYVFKAGERFYMIPETSQADSIRLYVARDFPTKWRFVGTLLSGGSFVDNCILHHNGRWWIFSETNPRISDTLSLYSAKRLIGPYVEHPKSPLIVGDRNIARPGGRMIKCGDTIIRYAQDDYPTYGNQVWAFLITTLTTTDYHETPVKNPIIRASGVGWNKDGMHTIDPHRLGTGQWISVVDGYELPAVQ